MRTLQILGTGCPKCKKLVENAGVSNGNERRKDDR